METRRRSHKSKVVFTGFFLNQHRKNRFADEKGKLDTTANGVFQKIISDVFMAWYVAKRDLGSHQDKESLEKGYDSFQNYISQLDALGAGVSDEDANQKFFEIKSLQEDRECKFKSTKDGSKQEAGRGQDFKPVRNEKEALMTIDEVCFRSFNALKAKYDELQSEFGDQEAALTAHKLANQIFEKDEKLKKYRRIGMKAVKDKDALQKIVDSWFASSKNLWKLIDCGMSSTVKIGLGYGIQSNAEVLSYEEEMDRGIFVLKETDPGEVIDDSLYVYGKYGPQPQSPSPTVSNVSSISFSICPSNDSDGELGTVSGASSTHYSTCQSNDSDGEPGTVSDHSVNDDPVSTQKTQPKVPTPTQTVDPSCAQHVKPPRQPIKTPVTSSPIPSNNRQNWNQRINRDLGAGYSFERKPCFVCGSLSHLIKNCDYYEKKMAREAALKSQRVNHTNARQASPAWTNINRVNKANQFTPRPVNIRPNLSMHVNTGRINVNTGHGKVSSGSVYVNSVNQIKSGASRFNTGKQHVNSGSMSVNSGTQIKYGSSRFTTGKQKVNSGSVHVNTARVNRPVSNNTSPKHSQVNLKSLTKCFSKQSSPVNRPFSRNTAYKSYKYAVKGKMGTAVKTSAGCVWRKVIPLSNINSGPTPDSNVSRGPQDRLKPVKDWIEVYLIVDAQAAEVCKAMLDKKLQGGKPDKDCYKLLKMMEKQAGIRKHKDWLVQEQTALGKDFSNPLMADNLPKIVWLSTHHICRPWTCTFLVAKGLATPELMANVVIVLTDAKRPGEDMCGSYRVMWRGYGMSKEGYGARWRLVFEDGDMVLIDWFSRRNVVVWTARIINTCKEEQFHEVFEVFNEMGKEGVSVEKSDTGLKQNHN
ncbi:ribonuclease H-like domain-containing protein [Tanacetum coccineum]